MRLVNIRRQASLGTEFKRVYNTEGNQIKLLLAKVTKVNPRYNTADVQSLSGGFQATKSGNNSGMFAAKLPVQFAGRTVDGKPYGQTTPVDVGTVVLVGFIEGRKETPIVLSVYSDINEAYDLSRSPVEGVDPRDGDMKKHTQHQFTVYPSLTYDDIDGEGNRTVSFNGKTFLSTDSDVDPEIGGLTDDGPGTDYTDLESSYYYSGELIEPTNGKAPAILFRHVGDKLDASGNVLEDDHVTMMHIAQDGTFRASVLKETEDWRTYLELTEGGDFRVRRQNDSQAIGQGDDTYEFAVRSDGILIRAGERYMLIGKEGISGNLNIGGGGGDYSADIADLKDGIRELSTSFEQTEEYIRLSATKVQEIEDNLVEFEATFEVRAEQIEARVTETITSLYDEELSGLSQDIEDLREGALESLDHLRDLSDDGKLTPLEKKTVHMEWDMIRAEYPNYKRQAELIEVPTTQYDTAYDNLKTYIEPLLTNMDEASNIDRITFMNHFESYFNSRGNLLYSILVEIKSTLDEALDIAIQAGTDASAAIMDASAAKLEADRATEVLEAIAADDKITAQEKRPLRREYRNVLSEWESYVEQAEEYEVDSINFVQAKEALEDFMESTGVFENMNTTTELNGEMLTQLFGEYYRERSNLLAGVAHATKTILLAYEKDFEYYETAITETSREINLMAQSIIAIGEDVELNRAEISIQADRIIQRVSRTELTREINSNLNDLNTIGRNLFIETQTGNGELDPADGTVGYARNDTKVTPYIQVRGETGYIVSAHGSIENNILTVAWFDSQRNYLDGNTVSGAENPLHLTVTSPLKARFARVSTRLADDVRIQFEKGSTPRPYKASPEDMVNSLDMAKEEYENRKALLAHFEHHKNEIMVEGQQDLETIESVSRDLTWSPSEKTRVSEMMSRVETWHTTIMGESEAYNVNSGAYDGAYVALREYVDPLLEDMSSTDPIVRSTVVRLYTNFFTQRDRIYSGITDNVEQSYRAAEKVMDDVSESAMEAQRVAEQLQAEAAQLASEASRVREAIIEANDVESSIISIIADFTADEIITPTEKLTVEAFLEDIAEEVPYLIAQANVYSLSTNDLETAYALLSSYLSPMLTGSNRREESEVAPQTFINRFQNYFTAKGVVLQNVLDGANGRYEEVNYNALQAQEEYRRRQDQMSIYQNAIIDSQFAIDRINDKVDEIANSVPYRLELTSSNGTIFRDNNIHSILSVEVFRGAENITEEVPAQYFEWTKQNEDGSMDEVWNNMNRGIGTEIEITHEDVQRKATFNVEVEL